MTEILVLGAGMVGVSSALALQARGFAVTLVDRREPGRETSFGNAGFIQTEAVEPYGFPLAFSKLLEVATKRTNDVNWHLAAMPGLFGPLARYFYNSFPKRHRAVSAIYSQLVTRAGDDHAPLIAAAGADALISREGFRQAYRSAATFDAAAKDAERLHRDYGVAMRILSPADLRAEEPLLEREMAGGVDWHEAWACSNPGGLVTAYADLFAARGGTIVRGDATTLAEDAGGWTLATADGPLRAPQAVIALGPWSQELLDRFGYRVRMVRKRGYHRHYKFAQPLRHPFMDTDNGAVCAMTPTGLRIATGADLTRMNAPADLRQIRRAEAAIRELFPLGEAVEAEPWFGHRPCMPDMLPMVGRAPRHKGLWLHFGHGHQGFTLGPTTADILGNMIADGAPDPFGGALAYRETRR